MKSELKLPSYKEQSPEVTARFERLYNRSVKLEVKHLSKLFQSKNGVVEALRDISFSVHRREFVSVILWCSSAKIVRLSHTRLAKVKNSRGRS